MELPKELESGYGCCFSRIDEDELDGAKVEAAYEGRVTWADSDQWERPEWTFTFIDELAEKYNMKISTRKEEKGRLIIYFFKNKP